MVNTKGLKSAEVLAALYNASHIQGMGFLQAVQRRRANLPDDMTVEEAQELRYNQSYFDYLYGRVMKVDLSMAEGFDERLYDRDNGEGAAQRAIDQLRARKDYKSIGKEPMSVEPLWNPEN